MRESKFRVWDNTKKSWIDKFIIDPSGRIEVFLTNDPNNLVLQQYTGIEDQNGKEIYEGDIIKLGSYYYEIVWGDYRWMCDDHGETGQSTNTQGMNHYMTDGCEVVGNIFENPILLNTTI